FQCRADPLRRRGDLRQELVDGAVRVALHAQPQDVTAPVGQCRRQGGQPPRALVHRRTDPHYRHLVPSCPEGGTVPLRGRYTAMSRLFHLGLRRKSVLRGSFWSSGPHRAAGSAMHRAGGTGIKGTMSDTLFRGGPVFTATGSPAEAVLVRDGRIAAV